MDILTTPMVVVLKLPDKPKHYLSTMLSRTTEIRQAFQSSDIEVINRHLDRAKRDRTLAKYEAYLAIEAVELVNKQTHTEPVISTDGTIRTAIIVDNKTGTASFEVRLSNGKTLCLINVAIKNGNTGGCVDIISRDFPNLQANAWFEGQLDLQKEIQSGQLAAILSR